MENEPALIPSSEFRVPSFKVLYLTHRVPYPPDKGDRIRNYHVLRQLARRGRVWLACLNDEPVTPEVEAELAKLCERVAIVPVSRGRWLRMGMSLLAGRSISEGAFRERGLRQVIADWTRETKFDAVVISASSLATYLKMPELAGTSKIVDLVDVDSQKWSDYADSVRGPKRWLYRLESSRVRKLERELWSSTKAVAMVSRAEAEVYDSFTSKGAATVAANGVDLEYFQCASLAPREESARGASGPPSWFQCAPLAPREETTRGASGPPSWFQCGPLAPREETARGASGPPSCVFVGAMDYWPNIDGAVWFAREIWPLIRAKQPDAEFRIVGRKPTPEVQRLAELPGVKLIGQVPDVRPFVAEATIVVAPLRLARGIQNKVLEAMAMGKAVIAAPPALAALKAEPGIHLLSAATPQEWVEAVCGLFANPERCRSLGAAARKFVEEHHHWDTCLEPLMNKIF